MNNLLTNFLYSEITNQDMYECIMSFILSYHIRCGEFEGNEYVIKKMDQLNYIIFAEYVNNKTEKEIGKAFSIYRNPLIKAINYEAQKKSIDISEYEDFMVKFPLDTYFN